MIDNKKVIVVLPAFNAENTLGKTYGEIPFDIVDEVVLVDDQSTDETNKIAKDLGIGHIITHEKNIGYGGNLKTCYNAALESGADIVIMLHPDYQYTPRLIHSMCFLITHDLYDVVLGSRILGNGALEGGMPLYKYIFNRLLTFVQNILMGQKLSEYHTGYRAFSAKVLEAINYGHNSDDFVFDNQMLAQACFLNFRIGEISCPTKYDEDSSSINLRRSVTYGIGVLKTSVSYFTAKNFGLKSRLFLPADAVDKNRAKT
jgi:glycosyltransferase involved in cell wall biosynthesis